jgi:thiamine transport system substrate-binding protein
VIGRRSSSRRSPGRARSLALLFAVALAIASCAGDDDSTADTTDGATADPIADSTTTSTGEPTDATTAVASGSTITLVTYDSFPTSDTALNEALAEFTADTGIGVEILVAGDTGTMLSKASLTAGNPEGDVMWGVDNTFLSRAIADGVFEPYVSEAAGSIPTELTGLAPNGEATPVDYGDVCINYDVAWFADNGLEVPTSLDDLVDPAYADLLVVQNPATSSPGLAFVLATIAEYGVEPDASGVPGWQAYWQSLVDNGVEVVDGWTQAYYERFSAAGGGPKPLVVSYGSSPPAGVIFGDPPTGVIESTCFRQVEFAGILRGTDAPDEARLLVDFLVGDRFQSELALTLFVYPANADVELPAEFVEAAVIPADPYTVDPAEIDANRSTWIDEWTELVIG